MVVAALLAAAVALLGALRAPVTPQAALVVHVLVLVGTCAWFVVVYGVTRIVVAVLKGDTADLAHGPLGWAAIRVAALVLVVAPFLQAPGPSRAAPLGPTESTQPARATHAVHAGSPGAAAMHAVPEQHLLEVPHRVARHRPNGGHRGKDGTVAPPSLGTGAFLVALASRLRRLVRTDSRVDLDDDGAVDVETSLLGVNDAPAALLEAVARALAAERLLGCVAHVVVAGGNASLDDGRWTFDPACPQAPVRCLVVILGEDSAGTHAVLVPQGATLGLAGSGAASLVDDALRVSGALDLGRPVRARPEELVYALAVRGDDDLVVCIDGEAVIDAALGRRCATVATASDTPIAVVSSNEVRLGDGRALARSVLAVPVRELLDGDHDRPHARPVAAGTHQSGATAVGAPAPTGFDDDLAIVRLLTAVPRVDGLAVPLEAGRERRAVELVAYLALHAGQPITGERLRVRVLGSALSDAAAKTLFNVASSLRRALGEGRHGPRLPSAGRFGHYGVAPDVVCDVSMLEARVAVAQRCAEPEEKMAWLRSALELIESEPFATVLAGYDWFLAEGHLTRLQTVCEDAACELIELAVERGLLALATHALDRARLVDPYAERLAAAAASIAAARQASFEAIAPAACSTVPSAPAVT
jgi:DNA-binding SARP family transcriptional activator